LQYIRFWIIIKAQLNSEIYQEWRLEHWLNDSPSNPLRLHLKKGAKSSPNWGEIKGRFLFLIALLPREELFVYGDR